MNVEHDRLSSLPDDLIHKILSFIDIRHAIKTSVLSSRWTLIWISMPYLNFSSQDIDFPSYRIRNFSQFVTTVLSRRNNLVQVFSINLQFFLKDGEVVVKQIMKYAFSHGIQELNVACLNVNAIEIPHSLLSSQSIKRLSLKGEFLPLGSTCRVYRFSYILKATSTWDLPSLTTLYLHDITLLSDDKTEKCIDLFSKCANLKNLTLKKCDTIGLDKICICLPRLSSLTLEKGYGSVKAINVVAPQLENLIIIHWPWKEFEYLISAPKLASFVYEGHNALSLSTVGFNSLEKVDLCIFSGRDADVNKIVKLFQELKSAEFLTLNMEIVELFSSYIEHISDQPFPFTNLKNIKINPEYEITPEGERLKKVNMSTTCVKSYLLDSSLTAVFKDIRATENTKMAQNLMSKLRVLLENEKANICEEEMAQVENKLQTTRIDSCWDDLSLQIKQGNEKTSDIIRNLKDIKKILIKLPISKRAEIQPSFSSLCDEANTFVNKIIDEMNLQSKSHYSVYFHELASTS